MHSAGVEARPVGRVAKGTSRSEDGHTTNPIFFAPDPSAKASASGSEKECLIILKMASQTGRKAVASVHTTAMSGASGAGFTMNEPSDNLLITRCNRPLNCGNRLGAS